MRLLLQVLSSINLVDTFCQSKQAIRQHVWVVHTTLSTTCIFRRLQAGAFSLTSFCHPNHSTMGRKRRHEEKRPRTQLFSASRDIFSRKETIAFVDRLGENGRTIRDEIPFATPGLDRFAPTSKESSSQPALAHTSGQTNFYDNDTPMYDADEGDDYQGVAENDS